MSPLDIRYQEHEFGSEIMGLKLRVERVYTLEVAFVLYVRSIVIHQWPNYRLVVRLLVIQIKQTLNIYLYTGTWRC